jgi:hypothetical protein
MVAEMEEEVRRTLRSLRSNRFDVHFAETAEAAKGMVLDMIPLDATVGVGDSATLKQLGILAELQDRGNRVVNPLTRELTLDLVKRGLMEATLRESLSKDVYITSSNAVTQDGKLVNTDRIGNRVAGIAFGAKKVIIVVGKNKIVRDQGEALDRIKQVIAPAHARWKGRNTPCGDGAACNDCDSADRLCRATLILEMRPSLTDMSVVLVNDYLGLGWDPSWPEERIEAIKSNYQAVTWAFPSPGQ